jgi:outer membrane protein assembly factor BamD (BamD/ComL family)
MAMTERFARLADASRRRHPSGRARLGGACLLLILVGPGCAGLNNPLVSNNPYEKDDSSGWSWFSGASEDKKPLLLPGAEDAKRTAMDEKARTDLEAAKLLYQQKEYAKAEVMFQTIAKAKKLRLDTLEDAQFYLAESQRLQGNYRDSRDNFRVYVQSFPYGKYASLSNERMYDIANYWLNPTRDEMKEYEKNPGAVRWASYNPYNWFNSQKDLPFSDVEGHAVTTLEDVRLNDIRGKLAEKSLFYIATVKFFRAEYKEADFFYSQLVEQHPKSELAEKALKQSIICKQISNGGTQYDTRLVEQCRKFLEEYQRTYPGKDGDWVNKQLVSIHYQQADRDFNVAAFYDRTGHPGSAYFCYELVRRRYPNTEYAKKADARMNALRSKVEEEQRNVKIEPNPPNLFMGIEIPYLRAPGLAAVTADNAQLISPLRNPDGTNSSGVATAGSQTPAGNGSGSGPANASGVQQIGGQSR